jgi:hypothetical protein
MVRITHAATGVFAVFGRRRYSTRAKPVESTRRTPTIAAVAVESAVQDHWTIWPLATVIVVAAVTVVQPGVHIFNVPFATLGTETVTL